jgi:hypothetical protein
MEYKTNSANEVREQQNQLRNSMEFLRNLQGTFYANQVNFGYRTALKLEDEKIRAKN